MRRAGVIVLLILVGFGEPASQPSISEKCQLLARRWESRFHAAHFNWIVASPFVIAGDGSAAQLARYRDGTILAAAHALRATYFTVEPDEPILILLFESDAAYRTFAKEWFGDGDVPHFGYCRSDGVMLMNVATGTGTLVHELTHALLKPDFQQVPIWFNEGLASLYEQSNIDGDSIRGLVNWRLPALKHAIQHKQLRPLRSLIEDCDFYEKELVGLNYAQARYLMMYLQEKRLLTRYYESFREGAAADPSGLKSLEALIAPQSLEEFERDWRDWVSRLR